MITKLFVLSSALAVCLGMMNLNQCHAQSPDNARDKFIDALISKLMEAKQKIGDNDGRYLRSIEFLKHAKSDWSTVISSDSERFSAGPKQILESFQFYFGERRKIEPDSELGLFDPPTPLSIVSSPFDHALVRDTSFDGDVPEWRAAGVLIRLAWLDLFQKIGGFNSFDSRVLTASVIGSQYLAELGSPQLMEGIDKGSCLHLVRILTSAEYQTLPIEKLKTMGLDIQPLKEIMAMTYQFEMQRQKMLTDLFARKGEMLSPSLEAFNERSIKAIGDLVDAASAYPKNIRAQLYGEIILFLSKWSNELSVSEPAVEEASLVDKLPEAMIDQAFFDGALAAASSINLKELPHNSVEQLKKYLGAVDKVFAKERETKMSCLVRSNAQIKSNMKKVLQQSQVNE